MNRVRWSLLIFIVLVTVGSSPVRAQAPGPVPGPRPPVSPYLNLIRRGTDPAINYYGLVRPEFDVRTSLQQLQQQVTSNQQALTAQEAPAGTLVTGHPSRFMNLGGYFMRVGTPVAGTGALPAAGAGRAGAAPAGAATAGAARR